MALVKRGDKRYLYRSVRVGDRVTSKYVASGELAVELADLDGMMARYSAGLIEDAREEIRRERRAARRARRKQAEGRARELAIEAEVRTLVDATKTLAGEVMRATGHRQHRWAWRRRRGVKEGTIESACRKLAGNPERALREMSLEVRTTIGAVINAEIIRRRNPDPAEEVVDMWERESAGAAPGAPSYLSVMTKTLHADPAREVFAKLLAEWSDDATAQELLRRQVGRMRDDLLGPDPTWVERLMVEAVVVAWLDLHLADRIGIRLADKITTFKPSELDYFAKRRERAHRRFMSALRNLELIRARALPRLRMAVAVKSPDGLEAAAAVEIGDRSPRSVEDSRPAVLDHKAEFRLPDVAPTPAAMIPVGESTKVPATMNNNADQNV